MISSTSTAVRYSALWPRKRSDDDHVKDPNKATESSHEAGGAASNQT